MAQILSGIRKSMCLYIVHLPNERSVTIIIIICDFEVIYSLGLLGAATVVNPSEFMKSYVSLGSVFSWELRLHLWRGGLFRVGRLSFNYYTWRAMSNTRKRRNPADFIKQLKDRPVEVKLNDDTIYKGKLNGLDGTMNVLLS